MAFLVTAAALAFGAAAASAHVTVKQVLLAKDEAPEVTVTAPNEEEDETVTAVQLAAPAGFSFVSGEAKGGWKLAVSDRQISWSGGELPPKSYSTFSFRIIGAGDASRLTLRPTYVLQGGRTTNEEVVPVELAKQLGGGSSDSSTTGLVYVFGAFGLVAFLLATAAFFLALRVWLETPRTAEIA